MRKGSRILAACAVVAGFLTGVDAGRFIADPGSVSPGWLVLSALVVVVVLMAARGMVEDPTIRTTIVSWSRAFEPGPASRPGGGVLVVALGAAGLLGLTLAIGPPSPDQPVGDEDRQVRESLAWAGEMEGPDAHGEPKPLWMAAGALGGGDRETTLNAGRKLSLAAGLLLVVMVTLVAGARGGVTGALIAAAAVIAGPDLSAASGRFTEDALFALLVAATLLSCSGGARRPWLWLLAGLCAGLGAATKTNGLLLLPLLVVFMSRTARGQWPWMLGAGALAVACIVPHVIFWSSAGPTKDTELMGLLALHGPETLRAMKTHDVPPFPGWGSVIASRLGIATVGDVVIGALRCFRPYIWWYLPVLVLSLISEPDASARRGWTAWALFVLAFLGVVGWKGGDAARSFYLVGPLCAVLIGRSAPTLVASLRRSRVALFVALLLASGPIVGLVWYLVG